MEITFRKEEEWFQFYDGKGGLIERKTEIRFDPLTGETSRIVFDPGLRPVPTEYSKEAMETGGSNCPFCPEKIYSMTPLFPNNIAEEGRIKVGEAVLFPNLFPYSKHNGVAVFSGRHYVKLSEFTPAMIEDALKAAQIYINKVLETDPKAAYASINWNYLPASGGSILHPHLHVIVSEHPTNSQTLIQEKDLQFQQQTGKSYFTKLFELEKDGGERWVGEKGNVKWIHAFSPKSHCDFIGTIHERYGFGDVDDTDWSHLAHTLKNLFAMLEKEGFSSFNMLLDSGSSDIGQPLRLRLIPRLSMGMLGTSDINFFQVLHQEPLAYWTPEDNAAKARKLFGR